MVWEIRSEQVGSGVGSQRRWCAILGRVRVGLGSRLVEMEGQSGYPGTR